MSFRSLFITAHGLVGVAVTLSVWSICGAALAQHGREARIVEAWTATEARLIEAETRCASGASTLGHAAQLLERVSF
jgi:hypothetical protein